MSAGGSLRQIRRRIRSVENTKKITRAMEMVAAAKLRRFEDLLRSFEPYMGRLGELLRSLLAEAPSGYDHPYLERPAPSGSAERTALVLFTSDTGLCGTYNSDLEEKIGEYRQEHPQKKCSLVFVGKHGASAFRRRNLDTLAVFADLRISHLEQILEGARKTLEEAFQSCRVTEVVAIYTRMETLSRYHPTVERLLPISRGTTPQGPSLRTILEPDARTVLDKLIPSFFEGSLRFILYHALLSEQIARMTTMRQATQNAEDMIEELTLLRNKARQAAITKEIIEVVSGSRALRIK
jgi:F-type H+-transporting ATPase subunit gamma